MKFRIFYAPQVFRTWEKVFILTSDGRLYCEYLMRFEKSHIVKDNIDYQNFVPNDFSWGKGVEGIKTEAGLADGAISNYQDCEKELTPEELNCLEPSTLISGYGNAFKRQVGWVNDYLKSRGLSEDDWDQETYQRFRA